MSTAEIIAYALGFKPIADLYKPNFNDVLVRTPIDILRVFKDKIDHVEDTGGTIVNGELTNDLLVHFKDRSVLFIDNILSEKCQLTILM